MEYIMEFKPYTDDNIDIYYLADIEKRISAGDSITLTEAEDFLRTISYIARKNINPSIDNYDYKCDLAQSILCDYFKKINCKASPCATQSAITTEVTGHSFTTVQLNVEGEEKFFLVDPTYIQFFKTEKCQFSNYFVSPAAPDRLLLTPDPGYFIKEEDKEPIEFLLKYGYIELTPEYARIYGDSFYNTKPGGNPDTLKFKSIPGDIYINAFLKGREALSKTSEELAERGISITPFQALAKTTSKV